MNKQEEFWKLAQEMLAQKDFSRIKELEELKKNYQNIKITPKLMLKKRINKINCI